MHQFYIRSRIFFDGDFLIIYLQSKCPKEVAGGKDRRPTITGPCGWEVRARCWFSWLAKVMLLWGLYISSLRHPTSSNIFSCLLLAALLSDLRYGRQARRRKGGGTRAGQSTDLQTASGRRALVAVATGTAPLVMSSPVIFPNRARYHS